MRTQLRVNDDTPTCRLPLLEWSLSYSINAVDIGNLLSPIWRGALLASAFSASLGDIQRIDFSPDAHLTLGTRAVRARRGIPTSFPESALEGVDEPRQGRSARECSTERMMDLDYRMDSMFAAYKTPSLRRTHEAFAQSRRRDISVVELMALY
jgi:hypothetical protein